MSGFFSRKTLKQLVLYFLVGCYEYVVGYEIFRHIRLPSWEAFGIQSMVIGLSAFILRLYLVFPEASKS